MMMALCACGENTEQKSGGPAATDTPAQTTPTESPVQTTTTPEPATGADTEPTVTPSPESSLLFDELTQQLFIQLISGDTVSLHYKVADPAAYGIDIKEPTLGDYSYESLEKGYEEMKAIRAEFAGIDYDSLTESQQNEYDILVSFVDSYIDTGANIWLSDMLAPQTGFQVQLPILLAQYEFYTQDDIDVYIEVLKSATDTFESICGFERQKSEAGYFMNDHTADMIINQCRAFTENPEENLLITVFDERIEKLSFLSDDAKGNYKSMNRQAVLESIIPAYENLISTLESLKGTCVSDGDLCSYEGGKEFYEAMVRNNTGSSRTVNELKALLNEALASNLISLTKTAQSDPAISSKLLSLKFPETEPAKIIEYMMEAARDDFPEIGDMNYDINYMPEALAPYINPALYIIPPIDDPDMNHIYINDNGTTDMSQIFPLVAHEGYPGHMYQFNYYKTTNPSPARYVITELGYLEGWAQYCELNSYSYAGLDQNLANYVKANSTAVLCLYSLSDIGINYEGWDLERTIGFWKDYGFNKDAATEIYYTTIAEPGIYLPYTVGYLELVELRDYMNEKMGDRFELADFHTFWLENGIAPYSVLKKNLDKWIEEH